ncbi:hypothetical protein L209DRAFT_298085 [Thermothelomyces heterothallicus CBS 203.75]
MRSFPRGRARCCEDSPHLTTATVTHARVQGMFWCPTLMGPFLGTPFAALMSNISGLFGLDRRVANGRRRASSGCSVLDPRLEKGDRPAKGAATLQLVLLTLDPQVQGEWHFLCSP